MLGGQFSVQQEEKAEFCSVSTAHGLGRMLIKFEIVSCSKELSSLEAHVFFSLIL